MRNVSSKVYGLWSFLSVLAFVNYPLDAADKPETIWKSGQTKDGVTVISDGNFAIAFPADVKIEANGSSASASIKQTTGAKLEGYLIIERKDAPDDAKKAADPQQWLEGYVRDQVEKDRKAVSKSDNVESKDYVDVKLLRTNKIALGQFKGLKSITDHERALVGLKIEGGLHSVQETDQYLIGDHLYLLHAGGSGAPRASQLFGDHTGFHKAELAQQFFKSSKLLK